MAGDGQGDVDDRIVTSNMVKVRRLSDGSLFGCAGHGRDNDTLAEWLEHGGKKPKLNELGALRLRTDGKVEYINQACEPVVIDLPCAVGSGGAFAIGAMEAGFSPEEAVEVACKRDTYSGGKITVLSLEHSSIRSRSRRP